MPTLYWIDERSFKYQSNTCHAENWAENQKVDYFCDKWEWDSSCEHFTWDRVQRFEKGIKACIQKVRPRARCARGHGRDCAVRARP